MRMNKCFICGTEFDIYGPTYKGWKSTSRGTREENWTPVCSEECALDSKIRVDKARIVALEAHIANLNRLIANKEDALHKLREKNAHVLQ